MRKKREFLQSDLTPLIDVVFLLLIFFMATSVFKKDELALSLTLPNVKEGGETQSKATRNLTILVTQKDIALNSEVLSLAELEKKMIDVKDKKTPIELKIDKEVEYQRVIDVLNILKTNKFFNIDLVTEKKSLNSLQNE